VANFRKKSWQNHNKESASNHEPKDYYKPTVYKTRHKNIALPTINTCSGRFSFVKFCHCEVLKYIFLRWRHAHTMSQKVTKHRDFG